MIGRWHLSDLQRLHGGEITADQQFSGVSTDTRTIQSGDLFVALIGPNFDGHNFIDQAVAKGAAAVVTSRKVDSDVPQWRVADTQIALGQIGRANRQRFSGTVYAVTGSSGKTSVKEMLNTVLGQHQTVLATKGNLNNEIGVPLTLISLGDSDQVAVIEQGASAKGEIAYTTALSLPDVAILNNAMGAHLEGFGSLQGVVEAKGEIFSQLGLTKGVAVINLDDPNAYQWLAMTEGQHRLTFSLNNSTADVFASDIETAGNGCYGFSLHAGGDAVAVQLSVLGYHNVANALAVATALVSQNMPLAEVASGLAAFRAVPGRMYPHTNAAGALIIDDSYNANPGAVSAAIELLVALKGESILVLGDMAELGDDEITQHEKVGCRAAQKGTCRLWATGALSRHTVSAYQANSGQDGRHFETKDELIQALKKVVREGSNVLIKGSRSAGMDQVVKRLTEGE